MWFFSWWVLGVNLWTGGVFLAKGYNIVLEKFQYIWNIYSSGTVCTGRSYITGKVVILRILTSKMAQCAINVICTRFYLHYWQKLHKTLTLFPWQIESFHALPRDWKTKLLENICESSWISSLIWARETSYPILLHSRNNSWS